MSPIEIAKAFKAPIFNKLDPNACVDDVVEKQESDWLCMVLSPMVTFWKTLWK